MEDQIQAISRHMEGQETSDSNPHQGKLQNYLAFFPMYMGLRVKSAYIREKGIKSRIWKLLHVFRDDLGIIKRTNWSTRSKEFAEGQGGP